MPQQVTSFSYPDHVFPPILNPFPGLPLAPEEKIGRIENGYHRLVRQVSGGPDIEAEVSGDSRRVSNLQRRLSQNIQLTQQRSENGESLDDTIHCNTQINVDVLFKWARETVDFAENHFGLLPEIVDAAIDIIVLVAESQKGVTKFKGAAQYIMAVWIFFGLFNRRVDSAKALELFYASAKAGFTRALYRIGSEFEKSGDIANALTFFNQGVSKGDSACLYRMAMCYLRGHLGTEVDPELGMQYLYKASSTSDPDCPQSSYVFGLIQLGEIQGVAPPDTSLPENAGISAMERAAWLGFAPALLRMGMSWQGGEKGYDSAIALRYFHIASRQQQYLRFKGDANAGLGGSAEVEISKWMLCGSEGFFEPNEEYAFYFSKLASEFGNGIAEFAVGYFYEVGIFVQQDIQAALIWYGIAASHESVDAIERLKELNLSRQNTITKQQHTKTLSLKGRGSMKHFRRKASETLNSTKGSPYPEPEYPDVLRCSSRNSESPSLTPRPQSRVMSESFGPRPNPNAHPNDGYVDGTEGHTRRSRKSRLSLPADAYSTGSVTRLTPPQEQRTRKPSSVSPTRPRGASARVIPPSQYSAERVGNRRTSSPVFSSNSQKPAAFPGSQLLNPMNSVSLASRRPQTSLPPRKTSPESTPKSNIKYGNISLDSSPTPLLAPSPRRNISIPEMEQTASTNANIPPTSSEGDQTEKPGSPTSKKLEADDKNVANKDSDTSVKEAVLPTEPVKKNRFSVMGMIFGYGNKETENESTNGTDSRSKTEIESSDNSSVGSSSTATPENAKEKSEELDLPSFESPADKFNTRSRTSSPQHKWGENALPRAATMPIHDLSSKTSLASDRTRSRSPRKFSQAPESTLHRINTDFGTHNLSPPPSLTGGTRATSPKTPPRGTPSPFRYTRNSPSNATINSASTSDSADSESTVASSMTSMRSGSSSPVRRPNSNVRVVQAIPGGKGAKTFEEMGIPMAHKQRGDCVIM